MWDLRQKPIQPCYTASSSWGNVMVCFSLDDHCLLVSAVDNEVRQLLAVDGRLHLKFEIAFTGSSQNYTHSFYMNGRDYIISGGCDEYVVRICCAQTGGCLRDISLEGSGSGSMFVPSLRGDPFRVPITWLIWDTPLLGDCSAFLGCLMGEYEEGEDKMVAGSIRNPLVGSTIVSKSGLKS
ncbi:hypothetical protein RGQ29_005727 [Quercus rubra]|uniref:Uncharacterized protein n=1 Tax=Quercus rubra TaxID=3512 RepID=A0AAN7I3I8_QUERU|nr:hypothetical protein RGQ29_005727 [Quercus rubra]